MIVLFDYIVLWIMFVCDEINWLIDWICRYCLLADYRCISSLTFLTSMIRSESCQSVLCEKTGSLWLHCTAKIHMTCSLYWRSAWSWRMEMSQDVPHFAVASHGRNNQLLICWSSCIELHAFVVSALHRKLYSTVFWFLLAFRLCWPYPWIAPGG